MILTKTDNVTTLITILKWEQYQESGQQDTHQSGQQKDTKTDTNKNVKNVKNVKNTDMLHLADGNEAKKKKFDENSIEFRMSKYLYELIVERNPNHKEPNYQTWASYIDLLLRVDRRDLKEAVKILEFSQSDSFWQNNILSTKKFREKYDQLKLKMESKNYVKHGNGSNTGYKKLAKGETDPEELAEYLKQIYNREG